jgi:MFS family permease
VTTARRGAVAAGVLSVATGWNLTNVGAIASTMADAYETSLVMVGLFTTAVFVTHAATQVPAGRASDRFGAVRMSALAVAVICAGGLIALIAPHPALAISGRTVTGIGTGLAFAAGLSLIRDSGGSPFAQGLFGGLGLGACGVALATVPLLAGDQGWRWPYATSIGLAVASLGVMLALRPTGERNSVPARDDALPAGVLRDRRLYRLAALYSASYGLSIVVGNWVIEILERHSGLGETAVAVAGGLTLLLAVVTRPLGGWVLRSHPDQTYTAVVLSLAGGSIGTLGLLVADSVPVAVASATLVGIGAGIPFAPALAAAAGMRPDAPAASVGVVNGVANTVALVGAPLVGLTFSMPGDGAFGFAGIAALWVFALAVLPSRRTMSLAGAT